MKNLNRTHIYRTFSKKQIFWKTCRSKFWFFWCPKSFIKCSRKPFDSFFNIERRFWTSRVLQCVPFSDISEVLKFFYPFKSSLKFPETLFKYDLNFYLYSSWNHTIINYNAQTKRSICLYSCTKTTRHPRRKKEERKEKRRTERSMPKKIWSSVFKTDHNKALRSFQYWYFLLKAFEINMKTLLFGRSI